jgi:hypothetical protein
VDTLTVTVVLVVEVGLPPTAAEPTGVPPAETIVKLVGAVVPGAVVMVPVS